MTLKTVQVHTAIIEWDSGTEPMMFLHIDPTVVAFEAAKYLYQQTKSDDTDDLLSFFADYPHEPIRDADLLTLWHQEYRDATTVPWCTFEEQTLALPEDL